MKNYCVGLATFVVLWLGLTPCGFGEPLPVKTVAFSSDAVGRTMKYNIILPAKYDQSSDRYPVLYLLHGFSSNYRAWARLGAGEAARPYDLIVVMPDVGNSWYVNWAVSEDAQKNRWEDYMIKDLIDHIDATYRTIAKREGRAINGLSMGGYGAIMLGLKHPDLFCSIGSHSGALSFAKSAGERLRSGQPAPPRKEPSTTPVPEIGIEGFTSQAERTPKGKIFEKVEDCAACDPFQLVLQVPREQLPHIYLDCGTEDRLIASAQEFAKLLMEKKIPFTYAQSPGGHTGPYWTRELGLSMAVQYTILKRHLKDSAKSSVPAATKEN